MESPSIIDIDHQYMICVKKNVFGDIVSLIADRLVVTGFFIIDQVRVKIISQCVESPLPIQSTAHSPLKNPIWHKQSNPIYPAPISPRGESHKVNG